ncbi:hypothetical protein [Pedobacter nyackensis]|uniref:hypothetical protein n=1 Tax=Pedobacter nyackensis TaxID=475255 RepID=UPI0029314419|nr:hypothetical protein [Pedobacter nyackensis]
MSVNLEISNLWHQLSADSYQLASLEDLQFSSLQKSALVNKITQTARRIKHLQTQPSYDGTKLLKLPTGNQVAADIAIFGAMNFLAEMGLKLDFKPTENTASKRSTIVKDKGTDVGSIIGGVVVGAFSTWAFIYSLIAFINSSIGKVDVATGVTLGIILLPISLAGFFLTYILFTNK